MTYFDVIAMPELQPTGVLPDGKGWVEPASLPRNDADDKISVEYVTAGDLSRIVPDWLDLLKRALDPNVFMDPAFVIGAAKSAAQRQVVTLLAWRGRDDDRILAGVWSFKVNLPALSLVKIPVLMAPACSHAYLAAPVVDSHAPDDVLDALLSAIERDANLPKTIVLDPVDMHSETMRALARVLNARGSALFAANMTRRPILKSGLDGKSYLDKSLSGSTRKKLRQHRRRLEEKGKLEFKVVSEPDSVRKAFDVFMTLERRGWKGRRGTALLDSAKDSDSAAAMIAGLSERRQATIHALYLEQHPISMQIVLRAGNVAFTWKTAYDEDFGDYSPGMLLLEEYTREFLADRSIDYVDSCAYDDNSFMSAWVDRRSIGQIWISARRGRSAAFDTMCRVHFACLETRRFAKQMTASWRRKWMRR